MTRRKHQVPKATTGTLGLALKESNDPRDLNPNLDLTCNLWVGDALRWWWWPATTEVGQLLGQLEVYGQSEGKEDDGLQAQEEEVATDAGVLPGQKIGVKRQAELSTQVCQQQEHTSPCSSAQSSLGKAPLCKQQA